MFHCSYVKASAVSLMAFFLEIHLEVNDATVQQSVCVSLLPSVELAVCELTSP